MIVMLKPLSKLSPEQIRLLVWLSQPKTLLEVSREVGFMDDKYNGLHTYIDENYQSFKFDIRSLYRLEGEKLVTGKIVSHFGISWEHYFPTETGQAYVSLLSTSKGLTWTHFQKRQ